MPLRPAKQVKEEVDKTLKSVASLYKSYMNSVVWEIDHAVKEQNYEVMVSISNEAYYPGNHHYEAINKVIKELRNQGYEADKCRDTVFTGVDEWREENPHLTISWSE